MKKSFTFIIISLMALCASAQNLYIGSFYVTTPEEESLYGDGNNLWLKRYPVICDLFNFEQPDVLGLQSLTQEQLKKVTSLLTYHNAAGDILYNKNTVELDTCGVVDEMPEGCTCSWARLQKEGTTFYVFNICYNADNAYAAANRTRSAITAINTENKPSFVVGYLGVNETKNAYSRMTGKFNDSFTKAAFVSAEFGTVNNFDLENNHGTSRFDFVFVPKSATVKAYGQLQSGYLTQESDGSYKRRMLSTHFPVMAKVKL